VPLPLDNIWPVNTSCHNADQYFRRAGPGYIYMLSFKNIRPAWLGNRNMNHLIWNFRHRHASKINLDLEDMMPGNGDAPKQASNTVRYQIKMLQVVFLKNEKVEAEIFLLLTTPTANCQNH
jgi:hypothetical protein